MWKDRVSTLASTLACRPDCHGFSFASTKYLIHLKTIEEVSVRRTPDTNGTYVADNECLNATSIC